MVGVGQKFPAFSVPATVSLEKGKQFTNISDSDYAGQWKCYFFWPKDFTFVCPTEIAEFGRLNKEFRDRDCQVLGGSTDSEFVHLAWRTHHEDLKGLPFPMLADMPLLDCRSEAVAAVFAHDIEADFVDAGVLVPDAGDGGHRATGGIDGKGGPRGGDTAVLVQFAERVVELVRHSQLGLFGGRKLAQRVSGRERQWNQLFGEDAAA